MWWMSCSWIVERRKGGLIGSVWSCMGRLGVRGLLFINGGFELTRLDSTRFGNVRIVEKRSNLRKFGKYYEFLGIIIE